MKRWLAIFGIIIVAPAALATTGAGGSWTWTDGSGKEHSRAELLQVLAAHEKWIESDHTAGQLADLEGAKLENVDLRNANLSGVILRSADLRNADLDDAYFGIGARVPNAPRGLSVRAFNGDYSGTTQITYLQLYSNLALNFLRSLHLKAPAQPLECNWHFSPQPFAADLSDADLTGASLVNTRFFDTNLTEVDFSAARMSGSKFEGVQLNGATFADALLDHSSIIGSHVFEVNLSGADLSFANLSGSDLNLSEITDARLQGTVFNGAEVCQLNFQPDTTSIDAKSFAYASGLELLNFRDRPDALTLLRDRFREGGFREQERELTFALRSHDQQEYWRECAEGATLSCTEYFLSECLFDLTCRYGMQPARALILLVELWLICGVLYYLLARFSRGGGLYLVPAREASKSFLPHSKMQRLGRRRPGIPGEHVGTAKSLWQKIGDVASGKGLRRLRRHIRQSFPLARAAFFFSAMSAFNIGFRDVSAGRWIRLLTKRDYDIRARGWPRVIAGVQAIISVGLLALWLLTYFGRPFG